MSRDNALELAEYLAKMAADGFTIVTWNGLAFDFDILAEESADAGTCAACALGHVDMMFHAFCHLGYPIGLDKAAQGMGVAGKLAGMVGAQAPRMWAEGRCHEVLEYVAQDVRTTLAIAQAAGFRRAWLRSRFLGGWRRWRMNHSWEFILDFAPALRRV
jgi:hypothetical protein